MMKIKDIGVYIPSWLVGEIPEVCPYCGADLVCNLDTGVFTSMWCSNPNCRGHMAYKIEYLAKYYKIDGVGPATAREAIDIYGLKSHLDILEYWFPSKPPCESLSRIVDLACIRGIGLAKMRSTVDAYPSFEAFFASVDGQPFIELRDQLIEAEKHFTVKPPMSRNVLNIMLTGSIHGFSSRTAFLDYLNDKYGQLINIIDVKKRKTNVHFLVKEDDAVDHAKSRIAQEAGIPIVTPKVLIQNLDRVYNQWLKDMQPIDNEEDYIDEDTGSC